MKQTNIDKCNSKLWHFSGQPHPFPHSPKVALVQIDVLNSKNEERCSGIPHNLAHAPQPPHGHTRTQEIQFTKKYRVDGIKEIHFISHRSQFYSIIYPLKIDTHTIHVRTHISIYLILRTICISGKSLLGSFTILILLMKMAFFRWEALAQ